MAGFIGIRITPSLNVALFDVDTLAQAVMRAVRDGDAAALEGYWTRRRRTCGTIRSSAPG
jgi:2-polyprenyl-6-methoxyphenol hydroxylase-like FAD-dependent oxidoreductase